MIRTDDHRYYHVQRYNPRENGTITLMAGTPADFDYFLDPPLQPVGADGVSSAAPSTDAGPGAEGPVPPGGTGPDLMLGGADIMPPMNNNVAGVAANGFIHSTSAGRENHGLSGTGMDLSESQHQPSPSAPSLGTGLSHTAINGSTQLQNPGLPSVLGDVTSQPMMTPGLFPSRNVTSPPSLPNAARSTSTSAGRGRTSKVLSNVAEGGVQKRGRTSLNAEEKAAKDHKRILRNRELARVSNERRKGRIKAMETELQETRTTVEKLQDSIKDLERENDSLKSLLEKN